ncbi:uncharacterized protein [Vicugna pacos]|uniref:Uncharacterized protein n=1 Tax=Vicugna pacos TaxID=30538 RepID=A0ABM5D001_VICPA
MSFCLRPVLEAQLVFIGPALAPSSVLLPAPVGKQIAPPPNTGSDAALLCCGRAGHCPSGCRSQMLQTGQAGGRVVPPPSTSVRRCVPARQAGGRSPPACAAGSSAALCVCELCAGAPCRTALRPGLRFALVALRGWARGRPRGSLVPAPSQDPAACLSLWSKFSGFWRLYLLKRAMICWSSAGRPHGVSSIADTPQKMARVHKAEQTGSCTCKTMRMAQYGRGMSEDWRRASKREATREERGE